MLLSSHKLVSDLCQHTLGNEIAWKPVVWGCECRSVVWGVRGLCMMWEEWINVCVRAHAHVRLSHEYVCFKPEGCCLWERVWVLPRAGDSVGLHENVSEWLAWSCEGWVVSMILSLDLESE